MRGATTHRPTARARTALAALAALAIAAFAVPARAQALANPGFEQPGAPPPGWTVTLGAGRAGATPSRVESVAGDAAEGERALVLAGDAATGAWGYVAQSVPAPPDTRWILTFRARSEDVRVEDGQRPNAYARLGVLDAAGARIADALSPMLLGTRGWSELELELLAPSGAARVEVAFFLSASGTLRVDDVRLDSEPAAPIADRAVRAAALDALERHLVRTYPFFGIAGRPDADALLAPHRERALAARDLDGFAQALKVALDDLHDVHVSLRVRGEPLYTGPHAVPAARNFAFDAVQARVAETLSRGPAHQVARLDANVGYVRLDSLAGSGDEIHAVDAAMDRLTDVAGWILDLRANQGGAEDRAAFLAGRFAAEPIPYARHALRDPFAPRDVAAFGEPGTRTLAPRAGRAADARPIAVLTGPWCVSSAEGFLLMMDALPAATLVGLPSRGASGNPAAYALLPDLEVVASRWRSLTLAGECIEGVGVQPDVVVDAPHGERDPTLERALELLAAGR